VCEFQRHFWGYFFNMIQKLFLDNQSGAGLKITSIHHGHIQLQFLDVDQMVLTYMDISPQEVDELIDELEKVKELSRSECKKFEAQGNG